MVTTMQVAGKLKKRENIRNFADLMCFAQVNGKLERRRYGRRIRKDL